MRDEPDLELTMPDNQLVVIGRPEDFIDADLEVAAVNLDVLENANERSLEWIAARVLSKNRHQNMGPKETMQELMIMEKAQAIFEKSINLRERLAGIKVKHAKATKVQLWA